MEVKVEVFQSLFRAHGICFERYMLELQSPVRPNAIPSSFAPASLEMVGERLVLRRPPGAGCTRGVLCVVFTRFEQRFRQHARASLRKTLGEAQDTRGQFVQQKGAVLFFLFVFYKAFLKDNHHSTIKTTIKIKRVKKKNR